MGEERHLRELSVLYRGPRLGLSPEQDTELGKKAYQVAVSAGLPAISSVVSQNFSSSTYSLAPGPCDPGSVSVGSKGQLQKLSLGLQWMESFSRS